MQDIPDTFKLIKNELETIEFECDGKIDIKNIDQPNSYMVIQAAVDVIKNALARLEKANTQNKTRWF
jgi:hypothetical protein